MVFVLAYETSATMAVTLSTPPFRFAASIRAAQLSSVEPDANSRSIASSSSISERPSEQIRILSDSISRSVMSRM